MCSAALHAVPQNAGKLGPFDCFCPRKTEYVRITFVSAKERLRCTESLYQPKNGYIVHSPYLPSLTFGNLGANKCSSTDKLPSWYRFVVEEIGRTQRQTLAILHDERVSAATKTLNKLLFLGKCSFIVQCAVTCLNKVEAC